MDIFLIAEVAQAHDGSLGILHSYIDAIAQTGVNAVKFQIHIAEAESSIYEPFRKKFSYVDKTRYDYWKRMEFTLDQWKEIKKHCESVGLEFIASPFSIKAVEYLVELNVNQYKIGSGEVTNLLMIEKICKTKKPIILSTGLCNDVELANTVNIIKDFGNKYNILHCITEYPSKPENIGLGKINELKLKYNIPIGFSDHSGTIYPSLAAVALGAEVLEFHAVFDRQMFGPDAEASLTISEIKQLNDGVRFLEKAMKKPIEKNEAEFKSLKVMFGKSLAVNKNLQKGHVLTFDDLETKKPYGYGISAAEFKSVIGKKINASITQYEFLKKENLDE